MAKQTKSKQPPPLLTSTQTKLLSFILSNRDVLKTCLELLKSDLEKPFKERQFGRTKRELQADIKACRALIFKAEKGKDEKEKKK